MLKRVMMMKERRKKVVSLIAALCMTASMLTGCAAAKGSDFDESWVAKPEKLSTYTLNSSTDELLYEFPYLLLCVHNDYEALEKLSCDDIVTVMFVENLVNYSNCWIYDAKRGCVFYEKGPYRQGMICDYGQMHCLSGEESSELVDVLECAHTPKWSEHYVSRDASEVTKTHSIFIEYSDGTLESHIIKGYFEELYDKCTLIIDKFSSFSYVENPLYAEEWE